MLTKIFTILGGDCPFGQKCAIDSASCRQCPHYYRAGTAMFFWCNNNGVRKTAESVPKLTKSVPKTAGAVPEKRKRGRPAKKAISKPVKTRKSKNG